MSVILEEMAGPNEPLYPTHMFLYEDCPQYFLWKTGWKTIDLGNGLGRRKTSPQSKEQSAALIGTVIQRVIEDFYNKHLYKPELLPTLERTLKDLARSYLLDIRERFVLNNLSPSLHEMTKVCQDGVFNFLKTAKAHRLVAKDAKSEVKITTHKNGLYLGSKIDFVLPKKDSLILLDGKNTKHRMKYTNPDQLRFYSLVYENETGKKPDQLGYLWYRFPYDEKTGDQGIDWVTCTERDVEMLEERAASAIKGMHAEKFHATPKPKVCQFCDYESVCLERKIQKEENSKKRNRAPKSLPIFPSGIFSMAEDTE